MSDKYALSDLFLVIFITYAVLLLPSCAVTVTYNLFSPVFKLISPVPVIVLSISFAVAVILIEVLLLSTSPKSYSN